MSHKQPHSGTQSRPISHRLSLGVSLGHYVQDRLDVADDARDELKPIDATRDRKAHVQLVHAQP